MQKISQNMIAQSLLFLNNNCLLTRIILFTIKVYLNKTVDESLLNLSSNGELNPDILAFSHSRNIIALRILPGIVFSIDL